MLIWLVRLKLQVVGLGVVVVRPVRLGVSIVILVGKAATGQAAIGSERHGRSQGG